jgi:hypothetical protein
LGPEAMWTVHLGGPVPVEASAHAASDASPERVPFGRDRPPSLPRAGGGGAQAGTAFARNSTAACAPRRDAGTRRAAHAVIQLHRDKAPACKARPSKEYRAWE